jgi:hypothetical protein
MNRKQNDPNILIQVTRGGGILALLICLAVSSCNCGKSDGDKGKIEKLKIKIAPPAGDLKSPNYSTQLDLEIEEGYDKTENYKIKVTNMKSFDSKNWTGTETVDDDEKTKLVEPADGKSLNEILGTKELTKGDKAKLYCKFLRRATTVGLSASADISIVDQQGSVVGGPVTLRWTKK